MVPYFSRSIQATLLLAVSLCTVHAVAARAARPLATAMVTQVDDAKVASLAADRPGALNLVKDMGALPAATALPEIRLELKRPAALQAALDQLVEQQQDTTSLEYHHWLMPADLRAYGPAQADIDQVTEWLVRQGLTVNSLSRSGMEIDFGGSAAAVARAFHTRMHAVTLHGEAHISNMSAPSVPAALLPVIAGVTLNNFFPTPTMRSYVPETPWNNSCASTVLAALVGFTPANLCAEYQTFGQAGLGGSGSQSAFFTKPKWQLTTIPGMPNDNRRDQPDVSLFAGTGIFNHFYLECMSDKSEGGAACNYHNHNDLIINSGGGTSFGTPAFAGIAALIQQTAGIEGVKLPRSGNLAPLLYKLAAAQYRNKLALSTCNSTLGNKVSSGCSFYNVTVGKNAEPCFPGTPKCEGGGAGAGILYNKAVTPEEAYPAQLGYSLAVGLGTVNVTNLVVSSIP
jgi:hypothetical protein